MSELSQKIRRRLVRLGVLKQALAEGDAADLARVRAATTHPEAASDQVLGKADALWAELPGALCTAFEDQFDPARAGENAPNTAERVLFFHIPKTAGSALLYSLQDGFDRVTPVPFEQAPKALQQALNAPREAGREVVIGHFNWASAQAAMKADATLGAASMMRNPADRLRSQYLYNGSKVHPNNAAFRAKFPRFEDYLDSVKPNVQLRQMVGMGGLARQLPRLLTHYQTLGVTEFFPATLDALSRCYGLPEMREHVVNVGQKNPWQEVDLTAALREKIYLKHMGDFVVYRKLHGLFERAAQSA